MSKTVKSTESAPVAGPAPAAELSFEQALKQLEAVVEAMESQDLPLETLVVRYEEGTRLAQVCQRQLAAAEIKIQQLEQTSPGQFSLKPCDNPAE